MAYDLLIKNGWVIDGSGSPRFRGDVGVRKGKIVEVGRLRDSALRTLDVQGSVIAPGFIDTHCHFDAQVTWDPLCTYSCYHGATTVIIGNCSLALAPVRPGTEQRLCEFLSYVEAIPMETLNTVDMKWETIGEYMTAIGQRLGVNVGALIGHTAVRHYVMGNESQHRAATPGEIAQMQEIVRDGMRAGALGLSINRNKGHFDPQGVMIPALWAQEDEIFALGDVLAELGTGVIQSGGGREAELENRLMTRLSEATGRQVVYNTLEQSVRQPEIWKTHMALVKEAADAGIRATPMCSPKSSTFYFTMRNTQEFRRVPSWKPILKFSDEEKLRAYSDPQVRKKLQKEVIDWEGHTPDTALSRGWIDYMRVEKAALPKNKTFEGKTLRELAAMQGKGIVDAFLDLAVEENLDTVFQRGSSNTDKVAMTEILNSPNAYIGLSDSGAHVQFHGGYGYSSRLLGHWVREQGVMDLEQAVRRLTFDNASVFGIYDRGLLRPGMAADLTIFDADVIDTLPDERVNDLPGGAWRYRQLAKGVHYTIVNGQVIIEHGVATRNLPGRVLKNALHHEYAHA